MGDPLAKVVMSVAHEDRASESHHQGQAELD
jgi:hypothetical protein